MNKNDNNKLIRPVTLILIKIVNVIVVGHTKLR
jgi:hypothetical protein